MYDTLAIHSSDLRFLFAWSFSALQKVDDIYILEAGTPLVTVRWFNWEFTDFLCCMVRLERAGLVILQDNGDTLVPDSIGKLVWDMINPADYLMDKSDVPF